MLRTRSLGIVLFLVTTPLSAQFLPPATYPTGPGPVSVVVGDFNGDGIPDLAVVNHGAEEVGVENGVSVLLGNGDGTFRPHVDYGADYGPNTVITADFNNDGKLDLAVANGQANTNQVFILIGNGDGTFGVRPGNGVGPASQWLVAGDFNSDGNLDLAVASYGALFVQGGVDILLGNGDGTFKSPVYYPAGSNPFGIMTADFNHDGILDLAVVDIDISSGVSILLGNGDGTFQSAMFYAVGGNPRVGFVADFNGDGNLDIAVGNSNDNCVSILFGNGTGYFAPPVNYPAGANIQLLAAGDFNGDGKLDLVTANSGSNNVGVLQGNGDGTFQAPVNFATGNSPMWVAVADLNGDKAPDLVVANSVDNTVSVLLNKGTDFSISASPVSPATVSPGGTATSTISLKLLNLFNNPVTLTYAVQPAQSAPECSLSPNPATFDARGNATVTMTINTAVTVVSRNNPQPFSFGWLPLVGLVLIGAGVGSNRRSRTKLAAHALGAVLLGGMMFQAACGSGGNRIVQPPKTYTITVTGVSGSTQHSATTTIMVQ
jgi:FG-GAP-like repeat/FG-GAP repeat